MPELGPGLSLHIQMLTAERDDARVGVNRLAVDAANLQLERDALLTRLTEIAGERDEARQSADTLGDLLDLTVVERDYLKETADNLAAENARLRQQVGTCSCQAWPPEGPSPDCAVHGAVRALNEAQAEIALMRPVVEAAKAWRANIEKTGELVLRERGQGRRDLIAAVDALPQDPVRPPQSTLPAEQVPDGATGTDGVEAQGEAQGAPVTIGGFYPDTGPTIPTGEARIVDSETGETVGMAHFPPADPPWLEEAIEAATRGIHDADCIGGGPWCDEAVEMTGWYRLWAEAAIRAALPLIAAGVLREAADEIAPSHWYLGDHPWTTASQWLRERADRQVTT